MNFGKSELEQACRDHPESEMARSLLANFTHFEKIYEIIDGQWEMGWGSYLFFGMEYRWQREMLKKQEALFNVAKKASRALEIGVYLGHSLLVMLIANPSLTITCMDVDQRFSPKVVDYLNKMFNNRILYLPGSAKEVLPVLTQRNESYDLVHIDADHYEDSVREQYLLSQGVMHQNSYIVFDDYEATRNVIDSFIQQDQLIHITTPWCLYTNIVLQKTATTFVSAFLININQRKDRSIQNYIEYGKSLIQSKVNKIIFIDHTLYEVFQTYLSNPYTFYLPYQKEDMYFYKEYNDDDFNHFSLHTERPDKDTKDYMFAMCHKTEFIRHAIEKNPFVLKNDQYVWVDFGLNHMCKMSDDDFSSHLVRCSSHIYPNVRIASIWDVNRDYTHKYNVYHDILWHFAGSMFGGQKEKMIEFADQVKNKIDQIIKDKHSLMWEVNVWWLVYKENNNLFLPYYGSHDKTILNY